MVDILSERRDRVQPSALLCTPQMEVLSKALPSSSLPAVLCACKVSNSHHTYFPCLTV